jgi:membrane-bound ClpP family serine protease
MEQLIQITGAILILAGFILAQVNVLQPSSYRYLILNLTGSVVLAIDALHGHEWGFLLLEGVWVVVSAVSLLGRLRGREPARSH